MSLSSSVIVSEVIIAGGVRSSFMRAREVTLLPEPLSPTMPMASPASTSKEMPFTAWTNPSRVLKLTVRFLTSSNLATTKSSHNVKRTDNVPSALRQVRVERVAQTVSHQVEREHCDEDC